MIKATFMGAVLAIAVSTAAHAQQAPANHNALSYAVAWKQTAAEYQALYYQGFNVARMHVAAALAGRKDGDKPLAIATDLDDTLVQPLEYWGRLIEEGGEFFDDALWDRWIPSNGMVPSPGAKEFLEYCARNGVEIFYITSRDQGAPTYDLARGNIKAMGFPYKDDKYLTVLRDTSNKETRQNEIMKDYDVVVFLGDSLNDFRRKYYIKGDVGSRIAAMEADKGLYGSKYVLFPNPTDGHWIAAIFGESEPPASPENLAKLKQAATRTKWTGK